MRIFVIHSFQINTSIWIITTPNLISKTTALNCYHLINSINCLLLIKACSTIVIIPILSNKIRLLHQNHFLPIMCQYKRCCNHISWFHTNKTRIYPVNNPLSGRDQQSARQLLSSIMGMWFFFCTNTKQCAKWEPMECLAGCISSKQPAGNK